MCIVSAPPRFHNELPLSLCTTERPQARNIQVNPSSWQQCGLHSLCMQQTIDPLKNATKCGLCQTRISINNVPAPRFCSTRAVWGACLLVGCLTFQQHASVSQGRICSDNFSCCHTETEVADQTFYFTQSQYTDTGPPSPSADPTMPDAWQGSHWSANFEVTGMTRPGKNPVVSGIRTRDLSPSRRTL